MPAKRTTTPIRRARRADCAELTRVAHAAKRFWGYAEKLIRLWEADLTLTPEFVVEHPVYCAVRGSRVIGFYAVSGVRARRELEHMWVDPKHIGRGVGRRLFDHLLRHLRRARVTRLEIAADPNAEGFYLRLGARRLGSVPSRPVGRSLPLLVLDVQPSRRSPAPAKRTQPRGVRRSKPR